jgi:putative addiction module component (TIGR02574 family)
VPASKPDRQAAALNELPESIGLSTLRSEHVQRLGQYRDRCLHRLSQALQDLVTTVMVGVPAVEQRHERRTGLVSDRRPQELLQLQAGDRAELVMALWESLSDREREGELALTDEQRAELDRRWAEHLENPGTAIPWSEVRRKLLC